MFQVLVVEDDKELCDLFCTVLTDNGYTAVPAADGLAAFGQIVIRKNGDETTTGGSRFIRFNSHFSYSSRISSMRRRIR